MSTYHKDETVLQSLTDEQYYITQKNGTEHPGTGQYLYNKTPGLYVDIVSGEPLFTSDDKFDSNCGWPSFSKPADQQFVQELSDQTHGMNRIEVRSRHGDSHLGHVFNDGPRESGGLRYCINSASLKFIPLAHMEKEGYGHYIHMIKKTGNH